MMVSALPDDERRSRRLIVSFIAAAAASLALIVFSTDPIDLDSIIPWAAEASLATQGHTQATAIVLALPLIAAIPLVFRGRRSRQQSMIAFFLISLFVLVSINRVGILYLPSAWMLELASLTRPAINSKNVAEQP